MPNQDPLEPCRGPLEPSRGPLEPCHSPPDPNCQALDPSREPLEPNHEPLEPRHGPMETPPRLLEPLNQGVKQPEPPLESMILLEPLTGEVEAGIAAAFMETPGTANIGVDVVDAGSDDPLELPTQGLWRPSMSLEP